MNISKKHATPECLFHQLSHGQYDLMRQFVTDFYAALRSELEPMLGSGAVYLDEDRLEGGQFYGQALARNLFESATMILVYTPTYFSLEHPYCAREYKAMQALERERLQQMGKRVDGSNGLIIPVILRGGTYVPEEIRQWRHCYDFESFQLGGRRLSRHTRFALTIREIAGYVCERFRELQMVPDLAYADEDQFSLPGEEEIKPFLDLVGSFKTPFPRGGSSCAPPPLWAKS